MYYYVYAVRGDAYAGAGAGWCRNSQFSIHLVYFQGLLVAWCTTVFLSALQQLVEICT